jgi:protein XRP2
MGQSCFKSKGDATDDAAALEAKAAARKPNELKKFSYQMKLPPPSRAPGEMIRDPDHYTASNLSDTTWVRGPGTINDQRINIDNCKGVTFVLADLCDSVQVDDCTDCVFYIGPTSGSVFIRGCTNCKVAVIVNQFRMRDCKRVDVSIAGRSRPVIESSTQIGFGCYAAPCYFDQALHCSKARLSVMNNRHSQVHDFTPKGGNFRLLSEAESRAVIPALAALSNGALSEDEESIMKETPVVPFTHGTYDDDREADVCVVIFKAGCFTEAEETVHEYARAAETMLIHTKELVFNEETGAAVLKAFPALKAKLLGGVVVACSVIFPKGAAVPEAEHILCVCQHAAPMSAAIFETDTVGDGFGNAH